MHFATTSQTVGPYLHIGMTWLNCDNLASASVSGERITISGRVLDGDGKPVTDALIEIWQANAHGKYAHPEDRQAKPLEAGFKGFGRVPTDERGAFRFSTIKPGPVPGPRGSMQAPHLAITLFMRGLLKQLVTRIYFPEDRRNADDLVLDRIPAERRATLVAKQASAGQLEWNVILQGPNETVFFEI